MALPTVAGLCRAHPALAQRAAPCKAMGCSVLNVWSLWVSVKAVETLVFLIVLLA